MNGFYKNISVGNSRNINEPGNIFDSLYEEVIQSNLTESKKNCRISTLLKVSDPGVNIMLVGSTRSGKSSTINAMFDMSTAKVGIWVNLETKEIEKYDLGNLTIWDTPGLGYGFEEDNKNIDQIVKKLSETDDENKLLIDLVLVVIDASSKDLGVSYNVINNILIPFLGENNTQRILIALNKSDMAMKGRHWENKSNFQSPTLKGFLTKKVNSIKQRVLESTGVLVNPICYSAGYSEDDGEQLAPYNLSKLLYYILTNIAREKRLVLADNLNDDEQNWMFNDNYIDYKEFIKQIFFDSLFDVIGKDTEKIKVQAVL